MYQKYIEDVEKEDVIHYTVGKTYDNVVIVSMNEEVMLYVRK